MGRTPTTPVTEVITVTLGTQKATVPIRRSGLSRMLLRPLSVRQLLYTFTALETYQTREVPVAQMEAELRTVLEIRDLLATEVYEVWAWQNGKYAPITLDTPALTLAKTDGDIKLEVRTKKKGSRTLSRKRRRTDQASLELRPLHMPAEEESLPPAEEAPEVAVFPIDEVETIERAVTAPRVPRDKPEQKGTVRKSDWLRAQFLPEMEIIDFRGLFVGNKGLWILDTPRIHGDAEIDPAQITDLLLRGNGYRRSGNHVKALMCYQELVELDPHNADFRFLLETTYLAIAAGGNAV